jgi:purine-nucleoside phosphorylase
MLNQLSSPIRETVFFLKDRLKNLKIDFMIVLGSGLSSVLSDVEKIDSIPYHEIPNINKSKVTGHKSTLDILKHEGKTIAVLRGRTHVYRRNTPSETVRLIRALALLGVKTSILTNASGSTRKDFAPGDIIIVKDHIKLSDKTPLTDVEGSSIGESFIDMTNAYSPNLQTKLEESFKENKIEVKKGVYMYMHGPSYETASEVKMIKTLGADVVGMSTVFETIAMRQLGVEVAGLSIVTNYGTGVVKEKIAHDKVTEIGSIASKKLDLIFKSFIKKL